jgi:hypothetical protein
VLLLVDLGGPSNPAGRARLFFFSSSISAPRSSIFFFFSKLARKRFCSQCYFSLCAWSENPHSSKSLVLSEGGWIGGSCTDRSLTRVFSVFLVYRRAAPRPPLFWCTCRRRRQRVQAIAIASVSDSPRNFPARKRLCGATSVPALFFFRAKKSLPRGSDYPSLYAKRLDSIQL